MCSTQIYILKNTNQDLPNEEVYRVRSERVSDAQLPNPLLLAWGCVPLLSHQCAQHSSEHHWSFSHLGLWRRFHYIHVGGHSIAHVVKTQPSRVLVQSQGSRAKTRHTISSTSIPLSACINHRSFSITKNCWTPQAKLNTLSQGWFLWPRSTLMCPLDEYKWLTNRTVD